MLSIADSLSREVTGTIHALPCVLGMRPIAVRTVLAQAATTQTKRGLATQIKLFAIGVLQKDVPFHPKRTIRKDGNTNWIICHV